MANLSLFSSLTLDHPFVNLKNKKGHHLTNWPSHISHWVGLGFEESFTPFSGANRLLTFSKCRALLLQLWSIDVKVWEGPRYTKRHPCSQWWQFNSFLVEMERSPIQHNVGAGISPYSQGLGVCPSIWGMRWNTWPASGLGNGWARHRMPSPMARHSHLCLPPRTKERLCLGHNWHAAWEQTDSNF